MSPRSYFYNLDLPNYTTTPDIVISNDFGKITINNQKVKFSKGLYVYLKTSVKSKLNGIDFQELYYFIAKDDFYVENTGVCEIDFQRIS
jgi:hypothetical protein